MSRRIQTFFNWPFFWGCMDLLWAGFYAASTISQGRTPLFGDISNASNRLDTDADKSALIVGATGAALLLSTLVSGLLLIKRNRAARWLALAQTPFRFALLMPSFFIILPAAPPLCRQALRWQR